jgi:acyl-CoA synthetase (AMP-forming)/AMP-acid ligase II
VAREYRGRRYLDDLDAVASGICDIVARDGRHSALPSLRKVWAADELPAEFADRCLVDALEATVRPSDDLAIVFTSGSRGAPKGVIHTHGNAIRSTAAGLLARCIGPDDRLYIPMPFFWTGGFATGLFTMLVSGATLLTETGSDAEKTIELLERERATLFRGWPDQAVRIARHPRFVSADMSSLRPGSLPAVLPPQMQHERGARANLLGMTETFGPYSGAPLDRDLPPDKYGSCGQPFEGIEVRIVDPDSSLEVRSGEVGEIHLRGANMMRGICGRLPERTFDVDGFYATGDLGSLDADGYLWFHSRLDDMFKVSGATVYPTEVESALMELEGVRQAFVTDVADGERVLVGCAVVSDHPAQDLADLLSARISSFKVPQMWLVVPDDSEVPHTPTGKLDKPALQKLLEQRAERV